VLDELKAQGLWDKTAIVVVGDHGESLGEHNINAHGYHLYSPHTKVPFIVRVPGVPARRSPTPVGHVDLAPTLVNLARGPHQPIARIGNQRRTGIADQRNRLFCRQAQQMIARGVAGMVIIADQLLLDPDVLQ
jgi:arylsulfatase A-like enzyme